MITHNDGSSNAGTKLLAALRLHALGLSVFPVHAPGMPLPKGANEDRSGKIPLVAWKTFQERQPTPEEILGWWRKWPDANIGVVTGRVSGVIVLDVDGAEGEESLKEFVHPTTWHSRTGRGHHFFFQYPGK
jgi:hypothetical protein